MACVRACLFSSFLGGPGSLDFLVSHQQQAQQAQCAHFGLHLPAAARPAGCGKYRGMVPSGRPRAPSPTTTLEIPLIDSRGSSQALSPVFMSPNSSGGLTAAAAVAAPVPGCSMAAAVAAVERAVLAAPVPQHVHPRPDAIPIPQRWLSG